ncbi:TIR domain-containing protein [Nocardioides guangzhouensis]|uniref:TIR domain-containing protein n=1 Tax=Nocardioides guangzhouensis TaxID=2497878 RepID=A0A4Q4ZKY9_9ACTN|nr:TIR domain-containing protein [Nocardioides guangzhouensis]
MPSRRLSCSDGRGQTGRVESQEYRLLGDQPSTSGSDALGFHDVSQRLSELVITSRQSSPFTVGVDGGWGSGKSSLMMRLKLELDRRDDVETVWFNAWTAEGKDVLESLIKSVLNRIDTNILRRAMKRKRLLTVSRVAVMFVLDVLRVRSLADELWRQMQVNVETRNEIQALVQSTMDDWMSRDSGVGRRLLVVFIDDLDRCSPASVLQVFEGMKLYLNATGFIFVIGYDKQIISRAISGELGYEDEVTALDYLEKIVQFSYGITPPTDDLAQALIDDYLTTANIGGLVESSERNFVIDRSGRNPRRIKRFINNFVLAYQLDQEWRDIGAESLLRALILQMYYPDAMESIWRRRGADLFQECLDFVEARRLLRGGGANLDDEELAVIKAVFISYNLNTEMVGKAPAEETLRVLQEEVPSIVLKCSNDQEFVELARNIGAGPERERLLQKLELRWSTAGLPLATEPSELPREAPIPTEGSGGGRVYISYRRSDAAHVAARLGDFLRNALGSGQVFLDVDSIKVGDTYPDALRTGIEHAMAVLVLIGPQWLDFESGSGRRRLDDPADHVRQEVELALELGKRVVPILIDGAPMPSPGQLPPSLAGLSRRNALRMSPETFAADASRILEVLGQLSPGTGVSAS